MSHFQIGLVVLGGLVFAAVVVWSLWLSPRSKPEHRPRVQRKSAARTASHAQAGRREPGLAAAEKPDTRSATQQLLRDAPNEQRATEVAGPPTEPVVFGLSIAPPETGDGLNPLIDAIVPILLEPKVSAIPAAAALNAMPRLSRVGSKPFAIEGRNQISAAWERPSLTNYYTKFQAGVQLANRAGPISASEWSEFMAKITEFAEPLGLRPQFPAMAETLQAAQALDQFANAYDRQLVFVIYARKTAWTAEQINFEAGQKGFINVARTPGYMVLPPVEGDYSGRPVPVLTLVYHKPTTTLLDPEQSAVRSITITLDAAYVARDENVFKRLSDITAALCRDLDGILCDQDGHPLTPEAMQSIAVGLDELYLALEQQKLPAGAAVTRRLFS